MEEAWKTSGRIPWLHASATEDIEARLRSVRTPDPLGLGLVPLRDTEARKRPYLFRGVFTTAGYNWGYIWYRFAFPPKFILIFTQIHLGLFSNGFQSYLKGVWASGPRNSNEKCLSMSSIETKPVSSSMLPSFSPWLHASATEDIEARLRSVRTPDPLGLGLVPHGHARGSLREPYMCSGRVI